MKNHHKANRISKVPLHRKIKYLLNEEEWASYMADHYFSKAIEAGRSLWIEECWEFNRVVEQSDLTLEDFLGRAWQ
jgi:hypothetical protein